MSATSGATTDTAGDTRPAPLPPEDMTVEVLPPAGPNRVYLMDLSFQHPIAGHLLVVEGEKQQVAGTIPAGYMPNFVIGEGHEQLYVFSTFWSRGVRGERTDVITYFDAKTLRPTAEVALPEGRALIVDKHHLADLTSDGRFLLASNMTPTMSVSVIDEREKKYLGAIETPGCALVFPGVGPRFSSVCADGTLFSAKFDASMKVEASRSARFFDPDDPVYEHSGVDRLGNQLHFVSFGGRVHGVDLSQDTPQFAEPWSLLTGEDRAAQWRPGGWKLVAYHRDRKELYVIMHQGHPGTHKAAGKEVWVYDVASRKRVRRLELDRAAISIAVTQGPEARLYATAGDAPVLSIHDPQSGKKLATLDEMGHTPLEIYSYDRSPAPRG